MNQWARTRLRQGTGLSVLIKRTAWRFVAACCGGYLWAAPATGALTRHAAHLIPLLSLAQGLILNDECSNRGDLWFRYNNSGLNFSIFFACSAFSNFARVVSSQTIAAFLPASKVP